MMRWVKLCLGTVILLIQNLLQFIAFFLVMLIIDFSSRLLNLKGLLLSFHFYKYHKVTKHNYIKIIERKIKRMIRT